MIIINGKCYKTLTNNYQVIFTLIVNSGVYCYLLLIYGCIGDTQMNALLPDALLKHPEYEHYASQCNYQACPDDEL